MDNTLAMTLQPQSLEPTAEDVAMLTRQYQKALDGLFEAYQFGMMLRAVKERLEAAEAAETAAGESRIANRESYALTGDGQTAEPLQIEGFSSESARGPAREIVVGKNGNLLTGSGWNRGTGLKGWLAQFCPEINYSTAKRFLAVAEKTVAALALADAEEADGAVGQSPTFPANQPISQSAAGGARPRIPRGPQSAVHPPPRRAARGRGAEGEGLGGRPRGLPRDRLEGTLRAPRPPLRPHRTPAPPRRPHPHRPPHPPRRHRPAARGRSRGCVNAVNRES